VKATEAKLLEFLKKSSQFVIPIYQRTYSWTAKESRQLWDDVIRTGSDDAIGVHFVGSIVYIEAGQYHVTHQSPLLVIDGQQRLTTLTLLIAALAKTLVGSKRRIASPSMDFLLANCATITCSTRKRQVSGITSSSSRKRTSRP